MITTTLNRILACGPCGQEPWHDGTLSGWLKLLNGLGKTEPDDEPLPYAEILRINGLDDALWACRCEPQHARVWRLLAVQYARRVQYLMSNQRSIDALDTAERHANGLATDGELAAARAAAGDAAWAAAWAAARAAAWARHAKWFLEAVS